jgi:hypothetical protein
MMNYRSQFIGDWDAVVNGMATELRLTEDGQYVHALIGDIRHHWGTWAVEDQNGALFLTLHLQGAYPLVEPSPLGWQPVAWPAIEAWPVRQVAANHIDLFGITMIRRSASSSQPPQYAHGPGAPTVFTPPDQPSLPVSTSEPKPVMEQWQGNNDGWLGIRHTIAQTVQKESSPYVPWPNQQQAPQSDPSKVQADIDASTKAFIAATFPPWNWGQFTPPRPIWIPPPHNFTPPRR